LVLPKVRPGTTIALLPRHRVALKPQPPNWEPFQKPTVAQSSALLIIFAMYLSSGKSA
jgi:hypothetical protein